MRDEQLTAAIKTLRKALQHDQRAPLFERVVERFKYLDGVLASWDETHAEQARTALAYGKIERAKSCAMLIFDTALRRDLLRHCQSEAQPDGLHQGDDALEQAQAMEREVLL